MTIIRLGHFQTLHISSNDGVLKYRQKSVLMTKNSTVKPYKWGLNDVVYKTLIKAFKLTHIRKFQVLGEKIIFNKLKVIFVLRRDKQSIPSKIKNEVRMPTLSLLLNIALGNLVDAMRAYDSISNCSSVACHETNTRSLSIL